MAFDFVKRSVFCKLSLAGPSNLELVEAWLKLRFNSCDPIIEAVEQQNRLTIGAARIGYCSDADLQKTNDEKTIKCLKRLSADLEHSLKDPNKARTLEGCKDKSTYTEFMQGDSSVLKPIDKVYSASVSCTPSDSNEKFRLYSSNGKNVCVREYKCSSKFRFGDSAPLEPGNYVFRCLSQNSVQSDCDKMNFYECEGKEVSYSLKSMFGLRKSDPVPVKASKAPAAQ